MEFEKKLERLEEIVKVMEAGNTSLEESLRIFEEGVRLSRELQNTLAAAEEKVKVLLKVDADGNATYKDIAKE